MWRCNETYNDENGKELALIPIGKILMYPLENNHIEIKCSRIERKGQRVCYQFDWQDPDYNFAWIPVFEVRSSEALVNLFGSQMTSKM